MASIFIRFLETYPSPLRAAVPTTRLNGFIPYSNRNPLANPRRRPGILNLPGRHQGDARARPTPQEHNSSAVQAAIAQGADYLLGRDPAVADHPAGWENAKPSGSGFKPSFPLGYVSDVLQNLEALYGLGRAKGGGG
ncbi:MAG: hypothetical protein ACM3US_04130 [Sphingomonadaceae bacterium]